MKRLLRSLLAKGEKNMPKKIKKTEQFLPVQPQAQENRIVIDHPTENEKISKEHYAVRISTSTCERVEISVDGAEWLPCRNAAGHWWFDLHDIASGGHTFVVRMHNAGTTFESMRKFKP